MAETNNLFIDRTQYVEQIQNIIESDKYNDFFPLAIDGKWGSGKSALCEIIEKHFENKPSCKIFPLDAFKYDYIKDPFIAIFSSLKDIDSKFNENLKDFVTSSLRMGASYAGKLIYAKSLGLFDITKFEKDKSEEQKQISSVDSMISLLKSKTASSKYVILVDELDRCRPEFTMMFLEAVKHFFEINNLLFIFMINRSQLEKIIYKKYGYDSDENYLNKFFKLNMSLPNLKNTSEIKPFDYIYEKLTHEKIIDIKSMDNLSNNGTSISAQIIRTICMIITEIVEEQNYSLRDMDEIVKYIVLYSILENKEIITNYFELITFILAIIILKSAPNLAIKIITSKDKVIKDDNEKLKKILNIDDQTKFSFASINQEKNIDNALYIKKIIYTLISINFGTGLVDNNALNVLKNKKHDFVAIVIIQIEELDIKNEFSYMYRNIRDILSKLYICKPV